MRISLLDGSFLEGCLINPGQPGVQRITHHPTIGQHLTGAKIPCWSEVCQTVLDAMEIFRPLRAVGWDMAVMGDGPRLIKGNAWFDPALMLQGRIVDSPKVPDSGQFLCQRHGYRDSTTPCSARITQAAA